jgi:hypothetical protein
MGPDDALDSVLLPVLWELREHLSHLVLIGGWVPQLHRRFSGEAGWSMAPIATLELDILLTEAVPGGARRTLAVTLLEAGFRPMGRGRAPAVWERDTALGERIEFFLVHKGTIFFRRRERDRRAKDLLYIVEMMAQEASLVKRIESGIKELRQASAAGASVARTARNNVFVLLSQPDEGFLSEVSGALQVRHGWSQDLAKARARGFLSDFADLIPQDCGK